MFKKIKQQFDKRVQENIDKLVEERLRSSASSSSGSSSSSALFLKIEKTMSANLYEVLDQAIRIQSTAVLEEYVRHIEGDLDDLDEVISETRNKTHSIKRKYEDYEHDSELLQQDTERLLNFGKDALAELAQQRAEEKAEFAQLYYQQYLIQKNKDDTLIEIQGVLARRASRMKLLVEQTKLLLDWANLAGIPLYEKSLNSLLKVGDMNLTNSARSILSLLDKTTGKNEMQYTSERINDNDIARAAEKIRARLDEMSKSNEMESQDTSDSPIDYSSLLKQLRERHARLGLDEIPDRGEVQSQNVPSNQTTDQMTLTQMTLAQIATMINQKDLSSHNRNELRGRMFEFCLQNFDTADYKQLYFYLGIGWDNLVGDRASNLEKLMALIDKMERDERTPDLIKIFMQTYKNKGRRLVR